MAENDDVTPDNRYDPDNISRIIMLVYGTMEHGGPFWCYVAVKPSKYEAFKEAERNGTLDLYNFEPFGEIIVSAEGETPPEEVTIKVAEMYNTDPAKFFQPIDPMQVIDEKIEELKRKEAEEGGDATQSVS
jgi:hypothetical protein